MIKKLGNVSIWIVVILFITFLIGMFSWYFIGNDNPIEQISEHVIEEYTGLDIDFSPND